MGLLGKLYEELSEVLKEEAIGRPALDLWVNLLFAGIQAGFTERFLSPRKNIRKLLITGSDK